MPRVAKVIIPQPESWEAVFSVQLVPPQIPWWLKNPTSDCIKKKNCSEQGICCNYFQAFIHGDEKNVTLEFSAPQEIVPASILFIFIFISFFFIVIKVYIIL